MPDYQKLIRGWVEGGNVPIGELVGFRLIECRDGQAVIELAAGPRHHNQMGTVHGGVLSVLAEAAMGVSVASSLNSDEGLTTIQIQVSYLRPLREGTVRAVAKTLHRGKTIAFATCEVLDTQNQLLSTATSSWSIRSMASDAPSPKG